MSAATKKPKVAKKVAVKKKTQNGYKMPAPIPRGEVLTDFTKKTWEIGTSIGVGGFGEIYEARQSGSKSSKYEYAIKIEPSENGPLFVEMHFYMKAFKIDHIQEWMQKRKLKSLGVPRFIGSGSHHFNNEKYRFIAMERFGKDLWSLFVNNGRKFPLSTILKVAIQIVDILEYLHGKAYAHGDIKGSNLLLGLAKGAENQVFLVDYGLVSRFSTSEYKHDPKKAHNGTIEYTSRDAHVGVTTRRGDFEILAYNMLQWSASKLPWEKNLTDPSKVQSEKIKYMNNVPLLMETCFGKESPPDILVEFFNYIVHLSPTGVPDYDYCRDIFEKALKKLKCTVNSKLEFSSSSESNGTKAPKNPKKTVRATRPKKVQPALSDEDMFAESDTSESSGTEEAKEARGKRRRNVSPPKHKETVNSNNQNVEPMSWKNCPSFMASKVVRAGEYNKQSKADVKTRKRRKSS